MKNYKVGDIIKCMVTAIESYGFFVSTDLWYSGLVHISEMTDGYVKDINSYVKIGDVIYCQILEVDDTNQQIKLSIKNINYKAAKNKGDKFEEMSSFEPLREALPNWIDTKIKELNK